MGQALQVVTGQVTNPSTTLTALTPNTGDSFTVQSASPGSDIQLLNVWAFTATSGVVRIRSPRMHDQAQNMRLQTLASIPYPLLGVEESQKLYPQDNITVEMTGDAAAVDLVTLLVYYADLPGIAANLHNWSEIAPQINKLTTVEVDLTSSATSCNYSATTALNATYDTLIRNNNYALLGYTCSTSGGTLGFTGNATGKVRVGGPLVARQDFTANWFIRLNQATGKPTIPIFNSADVASIFLDVAAQAASTSFKVGVNLALLNS